MPVLILGGTSEARALAAALDAAGIAVTTSLAGKAAQLPALAGSTRVGGFGGPQGLARWLTEYGVAAVVDVTHPFAQRISASAAEACVQTSTPLLRLERPGWREREGDRWHRVGGLAEAAAAVTALGTRVLLTTGRGDLAAFADVRDAWFLVRCISPPDPPQPPHSTVLLDRGPYSLDGELALIDGHRIDLVVTKNSGGHQVAAKLDAARARDLPVIVIERPSGPELPSVATVESAKQWVLQTLRPQRPR